MFTKIIVSTFVACSPTFYFFYRDRRSIFSLEIVDFAYENKTAGDLMTTSATGSLRALASLACPSIFEMKKECKGCTFVGQKTSAYIIQSHQSMYLYDPLYEQPVGCSRTVPRDLLHRHPEPNI